MTGKRTGGRILADQLLIHGTTRIFGVPGESYLGFLDALYEIPALKFVTCRQEGGAAMMADAYAKLTGQPGICAVTRGPGATNGSSGVHVAQQDATPFIYLVGQVGRKMVGRYAFQEIDYQQMFGKIAKLVAQIEDPARIPEIVSHAFHVATSGRSGPVVLVLPEDMLNESVIVADAKPYQAIEPRPAVDQMLAMRELLRAAKKPCVLVGGSQWDNASVKSLESFAGKNGLPVITEFCRNDRFDNRHPSYGGNCGLGGSPKAREFLRASDCILAIGAELGEVSTERYSTLDVPTPKQTLVHVHPETDRLGAVYQPTLGIVSSPRHFALALDALSAIENHSWSRETKELHASYQGQRALIKSPGSLQMSEIIQWIDQNTPEDTIFANGAGNFRVWLHRFHQYTQIGTQVASTSGSMGYGLPGGIAAKLAMPDRLVIAVCGDGDFMMTCQELATAVHQKLPIIVLVVNNGMFGTIRADQERHHPNRVIGTQLHNPDFALFARSFGAHGELVESTEQFAPAFERARAAGKPALIELQLDPEAVTVDKTLSQLRPS